MKSVKKLLLLLVTFCLVISLVACDKGKTPTGEETGKGKDTGISTKAGKEDTKSPTGTDAPSDTGTSSGDTDTDKPQSQDTGSTPTDTTKTPGGETTKKPENNKDPVTGGKTNTTTNKPETTQAPETTVAFDTTPNTGTTACQHKNTKVINKRDATCTQNGYTGDTVCADCNRGLIRGSEIKATGHQPTLVNKVDATTSATGYTGDIVCSKCHATLEKGITIDKHVSHDYKAMEDYLLGLVNAERAKVGAAPVKWKEDVYTYTKARVNEQLIRTAHTRPDGTNYNTIYPTELMQKYVYYTGENMAFISEQDGWTQNDYVEYFNNAFMNSPGHRDAMLDPDYNIMTCAFVWGEYPGDSEHRSGFFVIESFFEWDE